MASCLDHKPLLLYSCNKKVIEVGRKQKGFKYEIGWNVEEECSKIVEEEWKNQLGRSGAMGKMEGLLSNCKGFGQME